jgi:SulP family sulfate permease
MTATSQSTQTEPSGIARILPILQWAPVYERRWFRPDLIAGLTVAALVVPKSLGYAGIAGVPIQHGLYAAAAGAILYAIFGTCKQIATGPSSALAAVAGGAVIAAGVSGSNDAVALVAAITLLTGILFLLLALFKMGWISQFLSKAVITGFLFGAAIEVVIGELRKLTGTEAAGSNAWQKLFSWFGGLAETDPTTLVVGILSLLLILVLRFKAPRIPGALVLVVLGIIATAVFDLGDRGVALVGDVPRGWAGLAIPDLQFVFDNLQLIASASVGLLLIGFSQSAGDAREFAARHRYRIDINQESVAQGVANIGSGLFQGIPVSTSLSASSLNDSAGLALSGALVLVSTQCGAGGDHHRRRRVWHDECERDAPSAACGACGFLDRHSRHPRRFERWRAFRGDDRHRFVGCLADLRLGGAVHA